MNEALKNYKRQRVDPVEMLAEDPLFLMYTSGTTGKPKGCQHSTGGYLAHVAGTSKYIQDIHPEDVYWCMADIGWITGHSYIVYGPLALAASSVVYEGLPTSPDAGRPWRIAEQLGVNIFHTSPTAIRALRRAGPDGADGLEVVLRRCWLGSSGDRRHVVANGKRRISVQHGAGPRSEEAGKRRARRPRHSSDHL